MVSGEVKIRDIVVTALCSEVGKNPVGEASLFNSSTEFSVDERQEMIKRLINSIQGLVDIAILDSKKSNLNGDNDITRISTNEFYYYTQRPLSLDEFELIQNIISEWMSSQKKNIHLILGSFAVRTPSGMVINVTPHVCSGEKPKFSLIVKNNTSAIDFQYKEINGSPIKIGDSHCINEDELPKITISGEKIAFTFNNIVANKLESNRDLITLVDICEDHFLGVAKKNIQCIPDILQSNPLVSHAIISNSILQYPRLSVGEVMHNDPLETWRKVAGEKSGTSKLIEASVQFGPENVYLHELDPIVCKSLQTIESDYQKTEYYHEDISKCSTVISYFNNKIMGKTDVILSQYIERCKERLSQCKDSFELAILTAEVEAVNSGLSEPLNTEVASLIDRFKRTVGFGNSGKAERIEKAFAKVPLEERKRLAVSQDDSVEELMRAIASHRHSFFSKPSDEVANSFKTMKNKFNAQLRTNMEDVSATRRMKNAF